MSLQDETMTWAIIQDDHSFKRFSSAADFLQGFLPPEADMVWSPDLFQWKLGPSNPAGTGYLSIATANGQVIGTTSITRKRLWVNGGMVTGAEIGDTYTSEKFRRAGQPKVLYQKNPDPEDYLNKSVFGRLVAVTRDRAEAEGVQLIYGTPNQNSMPGYVKRLNFFHYDAMRCDSFVRLRAQGAVLRQPKLRPMTPILVGLESMLTGLSDHITKFSSLGVEAGVGYPAVGDIDALWERLKSNFNFTILRDAAWFRFRYLDHPNADYQFATLHDDGELIGLMVFRSFRDMAGSQVLVIADWLLPPDDSAGFARLISEGIGHFAKEVHSIRLWAMDGSQITKGLAKLGFLKRGEAPVIFAANPDANKLYHDQTVFDISIGASDNV